LPKEQRRRIGARLTRLQNDLSGDIKKLSGRENKYRLRVGDFRILFALAGRQISIYAVKTGRKLMSNATIATPKSGKITLQSVYNEMLRLRERVEDLEDLRELNSAIARNGNKKLVAWDSAKISLELED
jgi:mRNA interferase RelE/StbE